MRRTRCKIIFAFLTCMLPSLNWAADNPSPPAAATPSSVIAAPAVPAKPAVPSSPGTVSVTPATAPPALSLLPKTEMLLKPSDLAKPQKMKLGYVDVARVSSESSLGKASAAQAKHKQEKLQAQITAKRKQLDKQKAAIETQISGMTPAQREAKAKEFQKKVEAFQKFGINAEKELQVLQEGLGKAFNDAITKAAGAYGQANGLALVIVKRELLYLSGDVDAQDVSDGIIKLMNEKFVKK